MAAQAPHWACSSFSPSSGALLVRVPKVRWRCMPPADDEPGQVTLLLSAARAGDQQAFQQAFAVVHCELRQLAAGMLGLERRGHTLQPTALVNEAFVKLCKQRSMAVSDRQQFMAVAAQAMRRVLVDHARTHGRQKRDVGNGAPMQSALVPGAPEVVDLVALDDALERLAVCDGRLAQIVELRFFAGLDPMETAAVLGIGLRTCEREWALARAFLHREMMG